MKITIIADGLTQPTVDNVLNRFYSIIDMGFDGEFNRTEDIKDNSDTSAYKLELTLHLNTINSEFKKIRQILLQNTVSFKCTENALIVDSAKTIAEDIEKSEKAEEIPAAIEAVETVEVKEAYTSKDEQVTLITTPIIEATSDVKVDQVKTKQKRKYGHKPRTPDDINAQQEAVATMLKGLNFKNNEELIAQVANTLFVSNFKRQEPVDTLKLYIHAYVNSEIRPKSLNTLANQVGKRIYKNTLNKIDTVLSEKLGVEITFMEFLTFLPDFKNKDENSSEPEEVILKKPRKPPKTETGLLKCFPKNKDFDHFLRGVIFAKLYRKGKIFKILEHMGLDNLPKEEYTAVVKVCVKNINMFDFYKPEQFYTQKEKEILEKFVNSFAKTLKEDANYITLKKFVKELSNIT